MFKRKNNKIVCICILIVTLVAILNGYFLDREIIINENVIETAKLDSALQINNPLTEHQEVKVLIIETNPIFNSIIDTDLYPDNNGHPKWNELFGYDPQVSIQEQIEDFEEASHGYFEINIVGNDYLNEFPTYTKPVIMEDGTVLTEEVTYGSGKKGYRMKENKYLQYAYDENEGTYSWWKLNANGIFGGDPGVNESAYSFDYRYLIERCNLVNRKNNNEFDQVWLVGMDPTYSFETMMIGRHPYDINGDPYVADCNNFIIGGASMSRRDAQTHAFGHGIEGIMRSAFNRSFDIGTDWTGESTFKIYHNIYDSYVENDINISSVEKYNQLNWWEKFTLNKYANSGSYTSVGNVHFPYNGEWDYNYENQGNVNTNWREWINYPNISGNFQSDNCDGFLNHEINNRLYNTWGECTDPDRLYMRFWLYLMPHITGYTEDGYLNNWWKYIYSLDFVDSITKNDSSSKQFTVGDKVSVNYTLNYASERTENLLEVLEGNNIQIGNTSVLNYINGKLYAVGAGTSTVKINFDGKNIIYNVTVEPAPQVDVTGVSLNKNSLSLEKGSNETLIATVTPSNATNKNVTWSSSNTSVATVNSSGKVTAVKAGTATITVTTEDGGKTATCSVTVTDPVISVTGVSLNKNSLSLEKGSNETLIATITQSNATNKNVTWRSSNTSIATVNSSGKVTAVKAGTATITVTTEDGGKTATCNVTVTDSDISITDPVISVTGVSLNKNSLSLEKGSDETLIATVTPSNATNKNVTWRSSNTSVATVNSSGKVTAVKAGTATITVTTEDGGKTATCFITVREQFNLEFEEYVVEYNDENEPYNYIKNIKPKTTLESVMNNIISKSYINIIITDANGNIVNNNNELVKTEMKMIVNTGIGNIEYYMVVNGDINGDGKSTIEDIFEVNKARLKVLTLQGAKKRAADLNDDQQIDFNDILKINKLRISK